VTPPLARLALVAGATLAGIAVAAGAFGAHGLKATLAATGQVDNWETACRYAMIHALALLAVGLLAIAIRTAAPASLSAAAWCFLIGSLIFSGCLAVLALSGITRLGAIVPIGGGLMIAGWALLAVTAARLPR
jgi:uncharacterized membrane protein YgdD (TMEM256/DUF423 family)